MLVGEGCALDGGFCRDTEALRLDIEQTKREISEIRERLDIKEILFSSLVNSRAVMAESVVLVLEEALSEAREQMAALKSCEVRLSQLRRELYDMKCRRGV